MGEQRPRKTEDSSRMRRPNTKNSRGTTQAESRTEVNIKLSIGLTRWGRLNGECRKALHSRQVRDSFGEFGP